MYFGIIYYIELVCIMVLYIIYYILYILSIVVFVRIGCFKFGVIFIYNGNIKS